MNITLGLQPSIAPSKEAAQHAQLVDAAQQFEGLLLQEMLKGMQTGKDSQDADSGDDDSTGSNDTLRSFGTEAVAHAIAKGGGVGIARQVVEKVTTEHAYSQRLGSSN
jgi:Rod binding domain-containing protein